MGDRVLSPKRTDYLLHAVCGVGHWFCALLHPRSFAIIYALDGIKVFVKKFSLIFIKSVVFLIRVSLILETGLLG